MVRIRRDRRLASLLRASSPQAVLSFHWVGELAHLCEVVEDLLERGLGHLVLIDVVLQLEVFHHAEEEANGVVVTTRLDLPRVVVVFHNLAVAEFALKVVYELITSELRKHPPEELLRFYLVATLLNFEELRAQALGIELLGQIHHVLRLQKFPGIIDGERERQPFIPCIVDLLLRLCLTQRTNLELQFIASTVFVFDMCGRTEALELALDHDAHLGAKCLCFLHRVRRDYDATLLLLRRYLRNNVPHESLGLWINTGRRFVQKDERRVAEHSHGDRQLSLVSAGQLIGLNVNVVAQIHIINLLLNDSLANFLLDSFH